MKRQREDILTRECMTIFDGIVTEYKGFKQTLKVAEEEYTALKNKLTMNQLHR